MKFFDKIFRRAKKENEFSTAKDAIVSLSRSINPEIVRYYDPMSPDEFQLFRISEQGDSESFVITEKREGKGYRIIVSQGAKILYSDIEDKHFTKLGISILTGVGKNSFIAFKEPLNGDNVIKDILAKMEPRDTLVRINDSHWKITRTYESCKKKWAEFKISESKDTCSYFKVTINYGRDTRTFYPSKDYSANFPYKILNERYKVPTSKKLF